MALFRRKATDSVLPEVDEYYQAERRDRSWLAWVLALVSVGVVVLGIIGLFLGGRWIYRKVTEDNNEVSTTENGSTGEDLTVDGGSDTSQEQGSSGATENDQSNQDTQNPQNTQNTQNTQGTGGQTSTPPSSGSTSSSSSNSSSTSTTPQTGDSNLPNTGPGDLAGIFVGVSTIAGGIHYVVSRKRSAN